eukprot:CFRG2432T1
MHSSTRGQCQVLYADAHTAHGSSPLHEWMGEKTNTRKDVTYEILDYEHSPKTKSNDVHSPIRPFDVSRYTSQLTTKSNLGRYVVYAPRCDSTHTILLEDFPRLQAGSVVVADAQGASKGRGSNVWDSPAGQLAFSFKIMVKYPSQLVCMQYLVSLAVVKACETYLPATERDCIIRLKWPNDIYTGKTKIGGVLCNSVYNSSRKEFEIVCGVGLNVFNNHPTTCLASLITDASAVPSRPTLEREGLLAHFMNIFDEYMDTYRVRDFTPFLPDYLERWMHSDEVLKLAADGSFVTVKGLSEAGYLLAEDSNGEKCELHPDYNSLDLYKGLLKKKINK